MSIQKIHELALSVRNWGRWGPNDEIGTLNYITPESIAAACRLATAGKVFSLGIPLARKGPQSGTRARFNPIHTMFRDGGDAPKTEAGVIEMQGYGGADDWIVMPLQCVTQWTASHVFTRARQERYDISLVTPGAAKNSIDKTKGKIAGRGVLLDVARWKGASGSSRATQSRRRPDGTAAAQKVGSSPVTAHHPHRFHDTISIAATGAATTPTILPASPSILRRGCTRSRLPPWPRTITRSRCALPKSRYSAARSMHARFRTWA
jgi:hypothetical protein